MTLSAWRYRDRLNIEDLRREAMEDPVAGPGEIVVDIAATALNYRDLAIARGTYHVGVSAPLIPLSDGAGRVSAIGAGVTRFGVGDLACLTYMPDWIDGEVTPATARRRLGGPTDGVLRQRIVVSEQAAVRAPIHMTAEEAACLPVSALTAYHSLYAVGRLRAGDTVVVQGTGGVSVAAVQLAHAGGARVISVLRDADRRTAIKAVGAHDVIVVGTEDWSDEVMRLTDRRGADAVIDVAGAASLAASIRSTRVGGQVHMVGYASGLEATFNIFDAIRHAVTISSGRGGHRTSFEAMARSLSLQAIRPVIDSVFPVADLRQAFNRLASGRPMGKIVVALPPC